MATDELSRTFAALADPTRRAILRRLSVSEASVSDLAAPFEMSLPAVSKHLQVLERAGLISRSREAQWRRAQLRAAPLRTAADWIDDYSSFWENSFDSLDKHLTALQQRPPSAGDTPATPKEPNRTTSPTERQKPND
jgi:DNA-binding transcriptional ArsR family regulator